MIQRVLDNYSSAVDIYLLFFRVVNIKFDQIWKFILRFLGSRRQSTEFTYFMGEE